MALLQPRGTPAAALHETIEVQGIERPERVGESRIGKQVAIGPDEDRFCKNAEGSKL